MLSIPTEKPIPVRPVATYLLIVVNVVVFIVTSNDPALVLQGASSHATVVGEHDYYRLVSAMFLHANVEHILFNMIALFIVGRIVEGYFGHPRFLLVYFIGGLCGSVASVAFGDLQVISVGASGAIFALFGAELAYFQRFGSAIPDSRRFLRSSLYTVGINFLNGIRPDSGIDNWAHFGGLFGGLFVAAVTSYWFTVTSPPESPGNLVLVETSPRVLRYVTVLTLLVVALLSMTLVPHLQPKTIQVENISLTTPGSWYPISNIQDDPFCKQASVECLLALTQTGAISLELDRFSDTTTGATSLQDFDALAAAAISGQLGSRPLSVQNISLDSHAAIQRLYEDQGQRKLFIFLKDGDTFLRFYAQGSSDTWDRYQDGLNAIIASVQLTAPS